MTIEQRDDWVGPCRSDARSSTEDQPHASWDLDVGDLQSWLRGQRICLEQCPFLTHCRAQRDQLYPYPVRNPQAVIWAGVAYSETGKILDTSGLRRLWATQRGRDERSVRSGSTATG